MLSSIKVVLISVTWSFAFASPPYGVERRIIKGELAREGQFPFFAQIIIKTSQSDSPILCGGSLVAPNKVLTAEHCVHSAEKIRVYFGSTDLYGGEAHEVSRVVHFADSALADIVVLLLTTPVLSVSPIEIIDRPVVPGEECVVLGFGWTENGGSTKLRYVRLHVNHPDEINQVPLHKVQNQNQYSIYVGLRDQGDACFGDSGGPLVCGGKLAGGVSTSAFLSQTCKREFPDMPTASRFGNVRKVQRFVEAIK